MRDGWINFQGDAWYHVRAIEHLVRNFPHRLTVDPYAGLDAPYVFIAPFFDYLVATTALVAGLGAPSGATIERVAAVMPALLGAVATLLVYIVGTRLFEARAGLIAAALLAIVPGPFLDRTLLGAADHHAAEIVLVLATIALFTREGSWSGTLAGLTLGAYYLTWTSAPLFAVALGCSAGLEACLVARRGRPEGLRYTDLKSASAARLVTMAAIALAMVALWQNPAIFRYRLQLITLAALVALGLAIALAERVRVRGWILAASCVSVVAAAGALAASGVWQPPIEWIQDLARFDPQPLGRTVSEMRPLFLSSESVSMLEPWRVFQATFPLGVIGLVALAARTVRRPDSGTASLVVIWSLVTLAATLGQIRFGYYLSPMLAILAGWLCSSALTWVATRAGGRLRLDVAIVAIAAAVFYPSLRVSVAAVRADDGMSAPWKRALDWMRVATPEPFADPDAYFRRYDPSAPPRADYTVLSWWDYGYWILRAGRRVPVSSPTQAAAADAARFFTATSETNARSLLDAARARYVIVDGSVALEATTDGSAVHGKFGAIALWAERQTSDFYEEVWTRAPDGRRVPLVVFHPDYYRSMAVRLARIGVGAVEPHDSTWVIAYAEPGAGGGRPREIRDAKRFETYADAEAYLRTRGSGAYRLVGLDPGRTCVPLAAMPAFSLVRAEADAATAVRVFAVR